MNIAVLTSGGDAPGMNAAIRAVTRAALNHGHKVYGIIDGFQGLIENRMKLIKHDDVSGMLSRGGTFLGSARSRDFMDPKVKDKAVDILKKRNIEALIAIGGDGTALGALSLHERGIKVIAIPGSIDNDVGGTDFAIGFHTALNTIVEAIDKLRDTSSSHRRCSVVEVMGREAGDLAVNSAICSGAEIVITKEHMVEFDDIYKCLNKCYKEGKNHAIVVVTEHLFDSHELADAIDKNSKFTTRATVLGHIQRGGSPVPEDRILATKLGAFSIELLNQGKSGLSVGIKNNKIVSTPIEKSVKEKKSNKELYELLDQAS